MQVISIRLELKEDIAKKFQHLKERLGYKTNTSVLIHLINERYESTAQNPEKKES